MGRGCVSILGFSVQVLFMDRMDNWDHPQFFFSHPSYVIFKKGIIFFTEAKVSFWLPIDNSEGILSYTIRAILDTKSLISIEETTVPKAL